MNTTTTLMEEKTTGYQEAVVTKDTKTSAREQARELLFNRKGTATTVPDNYPIGSQGSETIAADKYFPLFDRIKVESSRISSAQKGGTVFVPPYEAYRAENEFKYFTGTNTATRPIITPVVEKKTRKLYTPSSETLSYTQEKKKETAKITLTKQDKITAAIYIAVITFLLALIIATGVTVSTLQKNVQGLESDIAVAREINEDLSDELVLVNNEFVLYGKAVEMGMVAEDGYIVVQLVAETEPVKYSPMTNWFDKLCDFFSGIFGG